MLLPDAAGSAAGCAANEMSFRCANGAVWQMKREGHRLRSRTLFRVLLLLFLADAGAGAVLVHG